MSNFELVQGYATPVPLQLRWSDQDINGHLNNVRILTLMEEARVRATKLWMDTTPGSSGPKRLVRALNTNFDAEVLYGKDTAGWMWICRIGGSSFGLSHLLVQDGMPCVYTEATMVVIDEATRQPKAHSETFRTQLEKHYGSAYSR